MPRYMPRLTYDSQNITCRSIIERSCTLDCWCECILTLIRILDNTEHNVYHIYKDVCDNHALPIALVLVQAVRRYGMYWPEVPWITHFCEKIEKQHGPTVRIYDIVDPLEGSQEANTARRISIRWSASKGPDRNMAGHSTIGEVYFSKRHSCSGTIRPEHSRVIRLGCSRNTDGNQRYSNSSQNRKVGEPAEAL